MSKRQQCNNTCAVLRFESDNSNWMLQCLRQLFQPVRTNRVVSVLCSVDGVVYVRLIDGHRQSIEADLLKDFRCFPD